MLKDVITGEVYDDFDSFAESMLNDWPEEAEDPRGALAEFRKRIDRNDDTTALETFFAVVRL